jgi:hypothetical protein
MGHERNKFSLRNGALLALGGVAALAAVAAARWAATGPFALGRAPGRVPASVAEDAAGIIPGRAPRNRAGREAKGLAAKSAHANAISIQLRAEPVSAEGHELRLIARVRSRVPASRVEVAWAIPSGVELAQGRSTDALVGLEAGEERELEITVIPHTPENRAILVRAFELSGDKAISAEATLDTADARR